MGGTHGLRCTSPPVIQHPAFTIEPWCLRETELNLDILAQTESLFALSNGHIGWRGNLDEGDPCGLSGSYLNGVHELRPLPYAEAGYGYPERDQVVVNVTDGKLIRLLVDDEPFDVRYGEWRVAQPRTRPRFSRRGARSAGRVVVTV
jgi:alpha,alpha-trehalose phosphorylase